VDPIAVKRQRTEKDLLGVDDTQGAGGVDKVVCVRLWLVLHPVRLLHKVIPSLLFAEIDSLFLASELEPRSLHIIRAGVPPHQRVLTCHRQARYPSRDASS